MQTLLIIIGVVVWIAGIIFQFIRVAENNLEDDGIERYIPSDSFKKLAKRNNWNISYGTLLGSYKDMQFKADFYKKSWKLVLSRQEKFVPKMSFIPKTEHPPKESDGLTLLGLIGHTPFDSTISVYSENDIFPRAFLTTRERQIMMTLFEESSGIDISFAPGKITLILLLAPKVYGEVDEYKLLKFLNLAHLLVNTHESVIGLMETVIRDNNPGVRRQSARIAFSRFFNHKDFRLFKNDLLNHTDHYLKLLSSLFYKNTEMFPLIAQKAWDTDITILKDYLYIMKIIKPKNSLENLRTLYLIAGDEKIKQLTANAMEAFADTECAPFLLSALSKALSENTRLVLVRALGTCGTKEALPILREMQKTTIDPVILDIYENAITSITSRINTTQMEGMLSITEIDESQGKLSLE